MIKELYAIVAAVILLGKQRTSKRIVVFVCDNMSTVYKIQKGRSNCLAKMKLMRTLKWTAANNNFHFLV